MDTAPLTLFAQKVSAGKRLLFADLRRLRRDVLPDGITTREEAEVLLTVDRNLERADEEWTDYLVVMVTDFALSTSGTINQDTARWLAGVLSIARPKTTAAIAREIIHGADQADEAFVPWRGVQRNVSPVGQGQRTVNPLGSDALDELGTGSPVRYGLRAGLCCCYLGPIRNAAELEDRERIILLR